MVFKFILFSYYLCRQWALVKSDQIRFLCVSPGSTQSQTITVSLINRKSLSHPQEFKTVKSWKNSRWRSLIVLVFNQLAKFQMVISTLYKMILPRRILNIRYLFLYYLYTATGSIHNGPWLSLSYVRVIYANLNIGVLSSRRRLKLGISAFSYRIPVYNWDLEIRWFIFLDLAVNKTSGIR